MRQALIGIDIGTSGCKVLALDPAGELLASATVEYPLYQPRSGWNEQDPEDWWSGARQGLNAVMNDLGGAEIAGVSLSGQMHGMVALDSSRQVIRRAILWNDQRTTEQCDEITRAAGGLEGLLSYTNNMMLTGYTGGKILWMKQNEPRNYERTKLILCPKDYIRLKLTGVLCTDVSDASGTGLFDVRSRRWAWDIIDKIGLDRALFPEFVESTEQTGTVTPEAAELTGLPAGTAVFGGGGDAVISITGLGIALRGKVGVTLGTSGVAAAGYSAFAENPRGRLQFFCGNSAGLWTAFGCTLAAAGSYQWFHDALGGGDGYGALDEKAAAVGAGADGLLFLPYLTGERCPIFDPEAGGAFIGIRSHMGKGHFARAVMEGVSFSLRQVYETMDTDCDSLVVAGGGSKSALWRQILADTFGVPVRTVFGSAEGGAFGAALVAGTGAGIWSSLGEASAIVRTENETRPIAANLEIYERQYKKFAALYPALKQAGMFGA